MWPIRAMQCGISLSGSEVRYVVGVVGGYQGVSVAFVAISVVANGYVVNKGMLVSVWSAITSVPVGRLLVYNLCGTSG